MERQPLLAELDLLAKKILESSSCWDQLEHLLRCGSYGHRAVECTANRQSSNKRPASGRKESVVFDPLESGHVVFQDEDGHERPDTAMLDAGVSAYLCGYGPFRNYVSYLRELSFPMKKLKFSRCYGKFRLATCLSC